jgi:prepilin-type N-terminal cleavage/methylation domain-containing protein
MKHSAPRGGFTLLEMMLVLAVMVAVTALALPALSSTLDNQRLRRAADQVRASWVKARTQAMEKGRTYVFRYTPGTTGYSVEPWLTADDYLESDQLISLGIDAGGDSLALQASLGPQTRELPENVTVAASETAFDMRADLLAATTMPPAGPSATTLSMGMSLSASPGMAELAAPPIFFYPDGTTSTARLVLINHRQRAVTISLRGLTGTVLVGDLQNSAALGF